MMNTFSIAQNTNKEDETITDKHLPSIYFGCGMLGFKGNIGNTTNSSIFTDSRFGFDLGVDERIGNKGFAIGLNYLGGELSKTDRSLTENANFQSSISSIGVNLTYNFDNGHILPKSFPIAPFVTIGLDYLSFKSYADLRDANGNYYFYWSDGTLRSLPQSSVNAESATILNRDYTYETNLHTLAGLHGNSYGQSALSIPLGAGIAFKITPAFSFDVKASCNFTQTKWIDDASNQLGGKAIGNTHNDKYLYTNISVRYSIGIYYKRITYLDSATMIYTVPDNYVEPDYTNYHPVKRDENNDLKSDETGNTAKTIDQLLDNSLIPEQLRIADFNHDGIISYNEINGAIDAFFAGDRRFKLSFINKLLDYFYNQK